MTTALKHKPKVDFALLANPFPFGEEFEKLDKVLLGDASYLVNYDDKVRVKDWVSYVDIEPRAAALVDYHQLDLMKEHNGKGPFQIMEIRMLPNHTVFILYINGRGELVGAYKKFFRKFNEP